jgi:hypothetical protein
MISAQLQVAVDVGCRRHRVAVRDVVHSAPESLRFSASFVTLGEIEHSSSVVTLAGNHAVG